ncbi:MAG: protein kinase [Spirulinaceae cyanobacterium]
MLDHLLDNRYHVIEILGSGGFGKTYIAEDIKRFEAKCVVKQLKPQVPSPEILEVAKRLFEAEAKILGRLGDNPQIPALLTYFSNEQEFYLVQEFIEGHELTQELTFGKQWSESEVISFLIDILTPLAFVHQNQIVHRDIKPPNLIRRKQDSKIVLIDFGAVKELSATQVLNTQGQTRIGTIIGTPGYMPSEQVRGTPKFSSDVYAVGIIAIQALTGKRPPSERGLPEELQKDHNREIIWRGQVQVSPGLAAILDKMVRYNFRQRYHSAVEALQAVEKLANQAVAPTEQASSPHELTLQWLEASQLRTQTIRDGQATKNPGTFRIGRDRNRCDLVLSSPTVSGLHIEIYFNQQQQSFYLRNLRPTNPPVVNGQSLTTGEVLLFPGSRLQLGQQELMVKKIIPQQQQYLQEHIPTPLPQPASPQPPRPPQPPQPIQTASPSPVITPNFTQQSQQSQQSQQISLTPSSPRKWPLMIGGGVICVLAVGIGAILANPNFMGTILNEPEVNNEPEITPEVIPNPTPDATPSVIPNTNTPESNSENSTVPDINITLYLADDQCQDFVPTSAQVSSKQPATEAVGKLLDSQRISNFQVETHQVNINEQGLATVDLRLASNSRTIVSLASCESFILFNPITKTLTSNFESIKDVTFLINGKPY